MTGTNQDAKEAARTQPYRLHPTWGPGGEIGNYDTTTNTTIRITEFDSKTTPINTREIAVQTEQPANKQRSIATQTDEHLLIFVTNDYNEVTFSDCRHVQSQIETDLEGYVQNSFELIDAFTDVSNHITKLTQDAEALFDEMPVGTNFEYSPLKSSFSLSSLQPSTGLESPEHAKIRNERPYNSLTKKRKDPKQENWRRSWGSSCDAKEDFWSALKPNYDFLMDNNLIDSCLEIDSDIRCSQDEESWNLNTFIAQFNELYSFLNNIEETVYGKTENITNWALRASHIEEMTRCSSRRDLFNGQATRLIDESGFKDEVSWRVSHLNSKWEQVESALSSKGCLECEQESCADIKHEVKCLRNWMKEMESRLQPLDFHVEWTVPELEKSALEHMVLQRDIENHNKVVSSVVRLCKLGTPRDAKCRASNTLRVANGLERKYHLLFLRSLEWQCHIESLFKQHNNRYQDLSSDADSDEEPCIKQPRLSSDYLPYTSPNQVEDDDMDLVSVSAIDMDVISSDPITVLKMVTNERCSDSEPDRSDKNNYKNGCDTCANEKSSTPKDKNVLQKLPTPIDLSNNSITTINVGSYYCKHHDTDSEFETTKDLLHENPHNLQKSDSSDDEFTYSAGITHQQDSILPVNTHKTPDKESIHLLVQKVEELVAQPSRVDPLVFHTNQQKSKLSRVREWLNCDETEIKIDSCDASGECTSGDSEEEKESQSSEDFNDSIVTCRPQATIYDSRLPLDDSTSVHCEGITSSLSPHETTKVNLRPKRLQMKGNRPWSVSCLSQLAQTSPTKHTNDTLQNFSISESALHKLVILSPSAGKMRTYAASTNSIGVQGNLSTSSTVEESGVVVLNEGTKPLSIRKKKMRLRRKNMIRKNESGSESQSYKSPCHTSPHSSPTKPINLCCLVKSGSFSGSGSKTITINERSTVSDPSASPHNRTKGDTSTTSGADSEDDKKQIRFPKFLFGPHLGLVKGYCTTNTKTECRDSSPEKSSLNTTEEQSSSFSEQAWDNYQEKYLSENYSECHDSDAARRLLEFGEDYRCYLDSQSESAHSQNYEYSPQFRRKPMPPMPAGYADSDSEIEDLKQYINESKAQLIYTKDIYEKHVAMGFSEFLVSSDCGDIIVTCERHIYGLEVVIDANDDTKVIHDNEVKEVKALMAAWMDLKWSAKKMQSSRALYNEVISFKNDLSQYSVNPNPTCGEVKSKDELTDEISKLTEVQNLLQDKKRRLLELNVAVHRYIVSEDTPCYSNLKSEVSELYTLWNETCQSVNERLQNLSTHLQVWAQLESRLDELQSDLRSDKETMQLLDTALQGGTVSIEVASSVRDVAKVLSESQPGSQKIAINGNGHNAILYNGKISLSLLTEGSFSDSGISDEGSEQELSGREHRLTSIRRLVRQLEAIMAPDSEARIKMTQRLEQAENELRKLQNQCRGLIVKTAVCAEVQSRGGAAQNGTKTASRKQSTDSAVAQTDKPCSPDDPEVDPDGGSWFWRVIRASMPFQVALVALICMACLLEPSCCDSINNLNLSLTPQLRYVRGPPPV